jgi:hypothetical protein
LKDVDFPESTILLFLQTLYGFDYSPEDNAENGLKMAQVAYLYDKFEMKPAPLHWAHAKLLSIISTMSMPSLLTLLLEIVAHCERNDPLLLLVITRIKQSHGEYLSNLQMLMDLASRDPIFYGTLCFRIGCEAEIFDSTPLKSYAHPSRWLQTALKQFVGDTPFLSRPGDPTLTLIIPSDFTLSIDGRTSIRVHEWILYQRWNYFKRMIESGSEETQSKHLTFPSDMPVSFLLLILNTLYCGEFDEKDVTAEACAFLMSRGAEYDVTELPAASSHSGSSSIAPSKAGAPFPLVPPAFSTIVAKTGFRRLVAFCKRKIAEPMKTENCLRLVAMLDSPGMELELEEAITFVAANASEIPKTYENVQIIESLSEQVTKAILISQLKIPPTSTYSIAPSYYRA